MARTQTWTRNLSKKVKKTGKPSRAIVDDKSLESFKRQAEDLGLIIHGRPQKRENRKGGVKR